MKITQGMFSFLPELTDDQIKKQIQYAINKGWALAVEYTDDPHPRNTYWEMWDMPMFDVKDPAAVMYEVTACRKAFPQHYIKVNASDSTRGVESVTMSFIVNRPSYEPGYGLVRQEVNGRSIRYTVFPYATDNPGGERYSS